MALPSHHHGDLRQRGAGAAERDGRRKPRNQQPWGRRRRRRERRRRSPPVLSLRGAPPEAGAVEARPHLLLHVDEVFGHGRGWELGLYLPSLGGRDGQRPWGGDVQGEELAHLLPLRGADTAAAPTTDGVAGTSTAARTTSSTTAKGKQQQTAAHSAAVPPATSPHRDCCSRTRRHSRSLLISTDELDREAVGDPRLELALP
ncbi:hypothetical protein OsI_01227 [Oryza sativa Indica Group]|uniref:Uncharacterized protein n=1 Tax=Oryza sativa subsp. indica TaxID=39946 RepID=A2WN04_ORYSI|nr:hypothetical protein OsI_01227 [Oryza sativa Indica Group]